MVNSTFAPFAVDLYKPGHKNMYHNLSELIFSNMTPRSDKYFQERYFKQKGRVVVPGVAVVGVERAIKFTVELWNEFFYMKKERAIKKYKKMMERVLGPGKVDIQAMSDLHDIGFLPVTIRSQDEGVISPIGVSVFTISNEGYPAFFWVTNYLETLLSCETWKCITAATTAFQYYQLGKYFANNTCDNDGHLTWQFHDFSMRGLSCLEDAAKTGVGHLAYFDGSDNTPAIQTVEDYYDGEYGGSVPATEHSVATTNINYKVYKLREMIKEQSHGIPIDHARFVAEVEFLREYINHIVKNGIRSYVADSYDYWRLIREAMELLKDEILAQDGKLVLRPDTGNPVKMVIGYKSFGKFATASEAYNEYYNSFDTAEVVKIGGVWHLIEENPDDGDFEFFASTLTDDEVKGTIQALAEIFGTTVNSKGYKELPPQIGLIYGDSINMERAEQIFKGLEAKGFASNQIVFGIGSYTYQMVTRDTLGFAVKATGTIIDGQSIMVSKDPKTDPGKKSANGFLKVVRKNGVLIQIDNLQTIEETNSKDNTLKVVYSNGKFYRETSFEQVRYNARSQCKL